MSIYIARLIDYSLPKLTQEGQLLKGYRVKNLEIRDLSYLNHLTQNSDVIAGTAYADTGTLAITGPGYAIADAVALAEGDSTQTDTQTLARVQYYGDFIISIASAWATARAITGREYAYSSNFSFSFSISPISRVLTDGQ